jgi:hypothetical protein
MLREYHTFSLLRTLVASLDEQQPIYYKWSLISCCQQTFQPLYPYGKYKSVFTQLNFPFKLTSYF